ncbi:MULTISPECIES: glycosyltransferase [unclassified Endozoicomonas]|uniref:glycosyltransferase n=1 Tax=unclassified Endozoicomonas TaxID=2644528 RepID=UPI003BB5C9B2
MKPNIQLHLSNLVGTGAVQLAKSLLPNLLANNEVFISTVILPGRGDLSDFESSKPSTNFIVLKRTLPNFLSRFFECILPHGLPKNTELLVLGDIPLNTNGHQTVFVHTPNLVKYFKPSLSTDFFKYRVAQFLFSKNEKHVNQFIVQTDVMKHKLETFYPSVCGRVFVLPQPVPNWLSKSFVKRVTRARDGKLHLFYPAAHYPHKNHLLLSKIDEPETWPVEQLTLTIDPLKNPDNTWSAITCVGLINSDQMLSFYRSCDALLFLSNEESFGFPLVEAMFCGLPILCPDLPYARTLCGDDAIYFEADNVESLQSAIIELTNRLDAGWWPNWGAALESIPCSWERVAEEMLKITTNK